MRTRLHPQVSSVGSATWFLSISDANFVRMAHEHLGCSHACQRKLECGHFCESFCSQACSCSCAQFAALKLGRHRSEDVPLEQFLLQSAGAPSAMVQAALDRLNSPMTAGNSLTPTTALPPLQHESVLRARQDFIRRVAENEERQQKERAAETLSRLEMSSSDTAPAVIKDIYRPTSLVDGVRADKGHKLVQLVELPKFAGKSLLPKSAPTTTLKNSPPPVVACIVGQGRETHTPTEGVEALGMSNLAVGSKLPGTKGVGPKDDDEWLIEL